MAGGIHRLDAENDVVFRHIAQGVAGDVFWHIERVPPKRRGRIAPHDAVTREIGPGIGLPAQRGVILEFCRLDLDAVRTRRGKRGRKLKGENSDA